MIKRLRRRFIAMAMLSFALVLAVVLGILNILNYHNVTQEADQMLFLISENMGVFPNIREPGRRQLPPRFLSPEAPYENRFFSVLLGDDGQVIRTNTNQIAAVDDETAEAYARSALASGVPVGSRGDYRYIIKQTDNHAQLIVFLDCGRSMDQARSYLRSSALLFVCAMTIVFVLLSLLSMRAIRPISESYEKQKQFITDAGHEIKTPITIIDADAEVLSMELGDNEWVHDIQTQTKRLSELTADLINLSKMEETGAKQTMIDLPFSEIVQETAGSFQTLAKAQNKPFTLSVQPLLTVCGDEKSLRQLVSILLDNAVKYTPAEGRISLTLERQGRSALLKVVNTCEAMKKEQIPHLFDRFYRADSARTPETGGYGIGLSIARAVTEAHKGKIGARLTDGPSLTMTVTLPIAKTSDVTEPFGEE